MIMATWARYVGDWRGVDASGVVVRAARENALVAASPLHAPETRLHRLFLAAVLRKMRISASRHFKRLLRDDNRRHKMQRIGKILMKRKNQKEQPQSIAPRKRGRPPKATPQPAPVVEEAPKRRGRPPKAVQPAPTPKAEETPKRRGRPPKTQTVQPKAEPKKRSRKVEPMQETGRVYYSDAKPARPATRKSKDGADIVYIKGSTVQYEYVQDYFCGRTYTEVLLREYGADTSANMVHVTLSDIFTLSS